MYPSLTALVFFITSLFSGTLFFVEQKEMPAVTLEKTQAVFSDVLLATPDVVSPEPPVDKSEAAVSDTPNSEPTRSAGIPNEPKQTTQNPPDASAPAEPKPEATKISRADEPPQSPAPASESSFFFSFDAPGIVEEVGRMAASAHSYFWINSGAFLFMENGIARTIFGTIAEGSKWQIAFKRHNAASTDDGSRPQNIFRLITKPRFENIRQEFSFRIEKINESDGSKRNQSNGVLLMSRYADGNNLYYAGIRVDGHAVIKKKINGVYHTLAYTRVYPGTYNRNSVPNLIPEKQWIGLRSEVTTEADGSVRIQLFIDKNNSGNWTLAAEAVDDGRSYGTPHPEAHVGIRTDFMDVMFDDYRLNEIR